MKKLLFLLLLSSYSFSQIPTYYSSIDFTQSGNTLKNALANLITTTHTTKISYSPGVWNALQTGDLNPNNSAQVLLLYGYNDVDAICERYYEHNTASNETKTTKITAAPSNNNANVKRLQLKN